MPDQETTAAGPSAERQRHCVIAAVLHVRAAPSIDAAVSCLLHRGDLVEEVRRSTDGYWLEVRAGEVHGWCSHKHLQRRIAPEDEEFAWMPIALAEVGRHELPGRAQSPRIVQYLRSTTLGSPLDGQDETPWCSAFANWCVERAGYEGTDSAAARSWLRWGVQLLRPRRGCVVVLSRGEGAGHVGFWIDETRTQVSLLGGNQGDRVCVAPFDKARVLGYRAPA